LAKTASFEEIPVQRLPVYSRAEADLYHWAGKVLVAKGQVITPDIVAALTDAGITSVYTGDYRRTRPQHLEETDIHSVRENEPLPWAIFDRNGQLLAREGERLAAEQIDSLHRRGQKKIYYWKGARAGQAARFEAGYVARVRARLDEEIIFRRRREEKSGIPLERLARIFKGRPQAKPVLKAFEKFYGEAVERLRRIWSKLASGAAVRNSEITPLVNDIIDRYLNNRELMAALALAPRPLDPWADHAVATAVYSLLVAQREGYSRGQARDLVVAALFHDVGYVLIPRKLLEAERTLSKGERRVIFRHIEHALFLAGRIDWPGDDWLIAVYQHQERGTGAGYPSGYRAERIHPWAKILAAADVLHALACERPHRAAYPPGVAMNMTLKMAAMGLLDRRVVRTLARELSLFPIGATVTLSTGETARVVAASREADRPWVGVISDAGGKRLKRPKMTDLSKFAALSIRAETSPFEEPLAGF